MYLSKYNIITKISTRGGKKNVILNSLSGAIDILDVGDLRLLEDIKEKKQPNDAELLKEYISRGYIFESKEEEDKLLKHLFLKSEEFAKRYLNRFMIIPTYYCNLNCVYCYQKSVSRVPNIISDRKLNKIFEVLPKLAEEEYLKFSKASVVIYGGEPLLNYSKEKEIIQKIIKKCEKEDYLIYCLTNGVDLVSYCDMLTSNNVKKIQVTLDGTQEVHDKRRVFPNRKGTFNKIVKGIDQALNNNIAVSIRVNVDDGNIKNLPKLAEFIDKKGWIEKNVDIYLALVTNFSCYENFQECKEDRLLKKILFYSNKHDSMKIFSMNFGWKGLSSVLNLFNTGKLYFPKFKRCDAHYNCYIFDLYGRLYNCNEACGREELSIGRYFPSLKLNEKLIQEWKNRSIFNINKCKSCRMNLFCGGGCAIHAYYKNKDIHKPVCPPIEKCLKIALQYYLPIYLENNLDI